MSISLNEARDNAVTYAGRGWFPFPLLPSKKEPWSKAGQNDATDDEIEVIKAFADKALGNVGIHCRPSGLYVVDVDMTPWKNKVGKATWDALVAQHGHVETYTVRTWSGGLHYYYAYDGDVLTNTAGKLGKDIDTRGNGYVVAAPSFVREAYEGQVYEGQYEVVDDREPAPLPQWIIDALTKPEPVARPVGALAAAGSEVEARVQALAAELAATEKGLRNPNAAALAYKAGQYVGAGQIETERVITIFLDAITAWGRFHTNEGEHQMHSTISRQVEAGAKNPRAWEEAVAPFDVEPVNADPEEEAERDISMWSTDNGQGVFLRDRIGGMLYAVGIGWMVWDGKRWKVVPVETIQTMVSEFYRDQFRATLAKYADSLNDKYSEIAKAYKGFMSTARLQSILGHLKVTKGVLVEASDLDAHPELLNVKNGIVDLRTGEIRSHDRKMLFTKVTSGSYKPGFTHKDWDDAQVALDADERAYMQLRMGQAVTGHIPESDDAIFMVGHGGNGKSMWAADGVFRAVGDYAKLSQATLITKQDGNGATPERAGLRGTRFVLIEELPEGRSLSIAEMKRITGTSLITARDLYEKEFTFTASHTLFITTNYLPPVAEVDEGSWRRMCLIRFPHQFKANPVGDEKQGDTGLKSRLREGKEGQHDAILTWLIEGAIRYFSDRTAIMDDRRPKAIQDDTLAWRKEADRILAYLDERIVFDGTAAVATKDVYWDFTQFLDSRGHAHWASELFLNRLSTHKELRNHRVARGQMRGVDGLSRPLPEGALSHSGLPQLGGRPQVFRGVRFRTEADDAKENLLDV